MHGTVGNHDGFIITYPEGAYNGESAQVLGRRHEKDKNSHSNSVVVDEGAGSAGVGNEIQPVPVLHRISQQFC